MKKKFIFMRCNEGGFYLPFVTVIAFLALSIVTIAIHVYKMELQLTAIHREQIEFETILQMAYTLSREDLVLSEQEVGTLYYTLPPGEVEVLYDFVDVDTASLTFHVFMPEKTFTPIKKDITFEKNERDV